MSPPEDPPTQSSSALIRSELELIRRVTDQVVRSGDFRVALDTLVEGASRILGVERASILLLHPESGCLHIEAARGLKPEIVENTRVRPGEGIAGWVVETGKPLVISDVREFEMWRKSTGTRQQKDYHDYSALSVPLYFDGRTQGVMNFNHKLDGSPFNESDLEVALVAVQQAAVALFAAKLHEEVMKKKVWEGELEAARKIQQRLFPQNPPNLPGCEIAARCRMCHHVGGDYFDFELVDDNWLVVCIGDVSGHGLGSAILASSVRAWMRTALRRRIPIETVLEMVNDLFIEDAEPGMFMTALLGVIDSCNHRFRYTCAGHLMPMVIQGDQPLDLPLWGTNLPLGVDPGVAFQAEEVLQLAPGDILCLMTDGLIEGENFSGECFGIERFQQALVTHREKPVEAIVEALFQEISTFCQGDDQAQDDCTLIVMKFV